MTVRISQAVGLFQTPPNGPKHNGPKSGTDHNDRDPDVVEFGMIPTVGAVYDRAFVRTALPCVLDVKNARSLTAPTVQSHSVFLESSDSHADIGSLNPWLIPNSTSAAGGHPPSYSACCRGRSLRRPAVGIPQVGRIFEWHPVDRSATKDRPQSKLPALSGLLAFAAAGHCP